MSIYDGAKAFKNKYPLTVAFRLKQHAKVLEKHLNPGEEVLYVFCGQKNENFYDIVNTNIVVLTNKRILVATKRIVFGYFLYAITPDMFNDLTIQTGLIWGRVIIDTVKEKVEFTNIDKKAMDEIETHVSEYMMEEKKKYASNK